jgi:hypothetical protein
VVKVPIIADSLKKAILKEHEAASGASYGVSAILSSAGATCRSRSEGLLSLLSEESSYSILKFDIGSVTWRLFSDVRYLFLLLNSAQLNFHQCYSCSSCVYIDSNGSSHNIELDNFEPPKADLLSKSFLFLQVLSPLLPCIFTFILLMAAICRTNVKLDI